MLQRHASAHSLPHKALLSRHQHHSGNSWPPLKAVPSRISGSQQTWAIEAGALPLAIGVSEVPAKSGSLAASTPPRLRVESIGPCAELSHFDNLQTGHRCRASRPQKALTQRVPSGRSAFFLTHANSCKSHTLSTSTKTCVHASEVKTAMPQSFKQKTTLGSKNQMQFKLIARVYTPLSRK